MVDQCLQKRNDEHTHKCDDWTEEYLVWKPELVKKPEVIYVSYLFILGYDIENLPKTEKLDRLLQCMIDWIYHIMFVFSMNMSMKILDQHFLSNTNFICNSPSPHSGFITKKKYTIIHCLFFNVLLTLCRGYQCWIKRNELWSYWFE